MGIGAWLVRILEGIDETGNAVLGPEDKIPEAGNAHYTLSQRWAYERARGDKTACVICKILTFCFKPFYPNDPYYDHCTQAIKDFPPDLPDSG